MKNTYLTGAPIGAEQKQKANFYLFGLIGEEDIDLNQVCPNGVARVQNVTNVGDCLLAGVTINIYTPRTVKVSCAAGNAYELVPHVEAGVTEVIAITDASDVSVEVK